MTNFELKGLINKLLLSKGFKRDGKNRWIKEHAQIIVSIDLQKSNFGNQYYINYGFTIRNLVLDGWADHFGSRMSSINKKDREEIRDLLDFDNDLSDNIRKYRLEYYITKLIQYVDEIDKEDDLRLLLKNIALPVIIPLVTKRYFGIADEKTPVDTNYKPDIKIQRYYPMNMKIVDDKDENN